jgi:hypothetical protein
VTEWNERQAQRAPLLISPTIGAAIAAQHWYLWVRCPGCRTTQSVDLRRLDRHPDMMVTSLIPALSCRACRPHAPFAELVKLSPTSIAGEMREERIRPLIGTCACMLPHRRRLSLKYSWPRGPKEIALSPRQSRAAFYSYRTKEVDGC